MIYIASLVILLAGFSAAPAQENMISLAAFEDRYLEMINFARQNPLLMAESLGLDAEEIVTQLPDLADTLKHGLLPVRKNLVLARTAYSHTQDMFAHRFFGRHSLDGRGPGERMRAAGFQTRKINGESLGMVAFVNFIEPSRAVEILFRDMFKAELDPQRKEQRNLLNGAMREVGISLQAGVFEIEGVAWNVYIVTCDFATDQTEDHIERHLLRWINDFRSDPFETTARLAERSGDTSLPAGIAGTLSQGISLGGLAPLAQNFFLDKTALGHNRDILTSLRLDSIDSSGKDESERIRESGYADFQRGGEDLAVVLAAQSSPADGIAVQFMHQLVRRIIDRGATQFNHLTAADFSDIGIAVAKVVVDANEDKYLYLLVVDYAFSSTDNAFLIGSVYRDQNGNRRFDFGEELEGLAVRLSPTQEAFASGGSQNTARTTLLGHYQLPLENFVFYNLSVSDENGFVLKNKLIAGGTQNQLLDIDVAND